MRKAVIVGSVLVLVSVLFAMNGPSAQRLWTVPQPEPAASKPPSQVEVTNFPAVQEVNGTVSVGNLPLDGDGNLRVAGQSAAPSYRWIQVADQVPVGPGIPATFGPLDVAGWRTATFLFGPTAPAVNFMVLFGGDGFFATEGSVNTNTGRQLFTMDVHGPQAQVIIGSGLQDTNITLWLYLSN